MSDNDNSKWGEPVLRKAYPVYTLKRMLGLVAKYIHDHTQPRPTNPLPILPDPVIKEIMTKPEEDLTKADEPYIIPM